MTKCLVAIRRGSFRCSFYRELERKRLSFPFCLIFCSALFFRIIILRVMLRLFSFPLSFFFIFCESIFYTGFGRLSEPRHTLKNKNKEQRKKKRKRKGKRAFSFRRRPSDTAQKKEGKKPSPLPSLFLHLHFHLHIPLYLSTITLAPSRSSSFATRLTAAVNAFFASAPASRDLNIAVSADDAIGPCSRIAAAISASVGGASCCCCCWEGEAEGMAGCC